MITYLTTYLGFVDSASPDLDYANGEIIYLGENHLSFIETSALDASNVELAFQNILTGKFSTRLFYSRARVCTGPLTSPSLEIYRIVSSKALDSGDGAQATINAGTNITLSTPADDGAKQGGKCC